jgi:hypothetical protein
MFCKVKYCSFIFNQLWQKEEALFDQRNVLSKVSSQRESKMYQRVSPY